MAPFRTTPEFMEMRRLEAMAFEDATMLISVKEKHLSAALACQDLAVKLRVAIAEHDLSTTPASTPSRSFPDICSKPCSKAVSIETT